MQTQHLMRHRTHVLPGSGGSLEIASHQAPFFSFFRAHHLLENDVGERCCVTGLGLGKLKWVGAVHDLPGLWGGVELDLPAAEVPAYCFLVLFRSPNPRTYRNTVTRILDVSLALT